MSKRRANGTSAPIEEGAPVRRDDSALLAKPGAGKRPGLVQAAREAIAPAFCSVCCEPRKGLEPFSEKSQGLTGVTRTVWKCIDCSESGLFADMEQCEIQYRGAGGKPSKSKGGGVR